MFLIIIFVWKNRKVCVTDGQNLGTIPNYQKEKVNSKCCVQPIPQNLSNNMKVGPKRILISYFTISLTTYEETVACHNHNVPVEKKYSYQFIIQYMCK